MKEKIRQAYTSVFPGWWPLLDKYIPRMLEMDPDCTIFVKEKYATLRLRPYEITNGHSWLDFYQIGEEAEVESAKVCEFCGKPGRIRDNEYWMKTLCDECAAKDPRQRVREARDTALQYFDALDVVRQVAGSMRLSDLELTEEDEERLIYFILHPEEQDDIMKKTIEKHTRKEPKEEVLTDGKRD